MPLEVSPRATAELPGCGGRIKGDPEDFEVEELPAYQPSGSGEHLYLWVRKKDLGTEPAAQALASALGVDVGEIGWAGLKDRRAVTRQFFSVPAKAEPKLSGLQLPGMEVLSAVRHGNKLRSGHLRGNRFTIRIRECERPEHAEPALRALQARGVPNYFGDQRFGRDANNAQLGRALLKGERLARAPSRFQRKLYLSAFQSDLFNRALAQRMRDGTFATALAGDVMRREESGGVFLCEQPEVDQARVDAFEISAAGPLFGPKLFEAGGAVKAAEEAMLAASGVTMEDLRARGRGETLGARRAYRIQLGPASVRVEGQDVVLQFELSRGSYATVVLDEVMKQG